MVKSLFSAALCAGLCSCASVTVQNVIPLSQPPPAAKPQKIFVQPFDFDEGTVRVNREGQELTDFKTALQQEMAENLVERLRKYVANAEALPATDSTWFSSTGFICRDQRLCSLRPGWRGR